jgi:putative PIN family toxin of toxin-antitoxin system
MNKVFVDASVLFAAAYSAAGYARDLILLASEDKVALVVSQDVLEEVRRNLAESAPEKLEVFEIQLAAVAFEQVVTPSREAVLAAATYTFLKDAPIVAAAVQAQAEYLVTYDRKHLLDRPEVAEKSGLKIVTPQVVVSLLKN